jgi:hypothetical protein
MTKLIVVLLNFANAPKNVEARNECKILNSEVA